MATFTITRIVMYNETLTIEAETKDEALESAKVTAHNIANCEYLDTDYYDVIDNDDND